MNFLLTEPLHPTAVTLQFRATAGPGYNHPLP